MRILQSFHREIKNGAAWFTFSNFLPAAVSVLMGPLILRKVGLEDYAVLSMAGYLFSLAFVYCDFGGYPHLLAAFSKAAKDRFADLRNALILKAGLFALSYAILGAFALWRPRHDVLYPFLALSLAGIALPAMNMEWYLIAKQRYSQIFLSRLILNVCLTVMICAWVFSPVENMLVFPAINLVASAVTSFFIVGMVGRPRIATVLRGMAEFSPKAFGRYFSRIVPLAATQLVTPYFLAYSLAWFSLVATDKTIVGAFSIGYRIAIGFSVLVGPMVFYLMSRSRSADAKVSFPKTLLISVAGTLLFWIVGLALVSFYFRVSNVDSGLWSYSVKCFSILMLGLFFIFLRTPYVSRCTLMGQYRAYFLIHFLACAPILCLSLLLGRHVPLHLVPWLACVPDFFASAGFVLYYKLQRSEHLPPVRA